MQAEPSPPSSLSKRHAKIVLLTVGILFVSVLLMRGDRSLWLARVITLIETLVLSGFAPMFYLMAGAGYGHLIRKWIPTKQMQWCIELGFGLTLLLSLTHLMGILGLLNSATAWVSVGIGLILFLPRLIGKQASVDDGLTLLHVVIMCGMLLALVMACNPPGILWGSEYGGFDALSYHLQLPREWIDQGRIWPSEHNVYSFLPGYIENAYTHIALMMGGMQHDGGRGAISAQLLSALMLILSAACLGEMTRSVCQKLMPDADQLLAGRIAIALTFGTPWLLVVGTLAYNETAVVLLGTSALCMAMRSDIAVWKRAIICGFIVGGACSCKPTALFLLAPSIGIVLLACSPRKQWIVATLGCVALGAITISPWLIRNTLATGNPVFPQIHTTFGNGHWTDAQHALYASAHTFDGSLIDRIRLLVLPDNNGMDHVSSFRGLTNAQWALTPLLGLIGLLSLLIGRRTRVAGAATLLALGIPILAWVMLTHLQSRFLIPLSVLLIPLGSLAVVRITNAPVREAVAKVICIFAVMWSIGLALVQAGGNPFMLLHIGPSYSLGSVRYSSLDELPWTGALNTLTEYDETVYLLGDATPFYLTGDVRYNTVYDHWLIEDAIQSSPATPSDWTQHLRDQGIDVVVVSFSEINRYASSGWLPPSLQPQQLMQWIDSLGQPIHVWSTPSGTPLRAAFRISEDQP